MSDKLLEKWKIKIPIQCLKNPQVLLGNPAFVSADPIELSRLIWIRDNDCVFLRQADESGGIELVP